MSCCRWIVFKIVPSSSSFAVVDGGGVSDFDFRVLNSSRSSASSSSYLVVRVVSMSAIDFSNIETVRVSLVWDAMVGVGLVGRGFVVSVGRWVEPLVVVGVVSVFVDLLPDRLLVGCVDCFACSDSFLVRNGNSWISVKLITVGTGVFFWRVLRDLGGPFFLLEAIVLAVMVL